MKPNQWTKWTGALALPFLAATLSFASPQYHDDHHDDHRDDHHEDRGGGDWRFQGNDRDRFASHYHGDVDRWQHHPDGRPHFDRGQRIPSNYRIRPVPRSYWQGGPPPPAGYQYGYYDGYVVAYNPTTRIVADVLDLAAAATR